MNRTAPMPFQDSIQFYNTIPKPIIAKEVVSKPRESQLEEKSKRKKVFTGESNTIYCKYNYERDDDDDNSNAMALDYDELQKEKREVNTVAITETQLIGMGKYSKSSLSDQIDLQKIKEIRRAIRRRYANRTNFQKIYTQWDSESKGFVSIKNVHDMLKKMGFDVKMTEAQMLVASADKDSSNDLNMEEFMDLIFSADDALNMDISGLKSTFYYVYSALNENDINHDLISLIQRDAKIIREEEHYQNIKESLKTNLKKISKECLKSDKGRKGYLKRNEFTELLEKLRFPEVYLTNELKKKLYVEFETPSEDFDYLRLIDYLKNYEREKIENKINLTFTKDDISKRLALYDIRDEDSGRKLVFDPSKQNVAFLEREWKTAQNVIRSFRRKYNAQAFKTFLEGKIENEQISKEDVKEFLEKELHDEPNIGKKEIGAFMTLMSFSSHNQIQRNQIHELLYNETVNDFFVRISGNNRGLPRILSAQESGKAAEEDSSGKQINKILEKIDNRVFLGTRKAYKIFTEFDEDKDGFISYNDIKEKMKKLAILNEEETKLFMNYIDPEKKGFLNFNQFSEKVRCNVTSTDNLGINIVIPATAPSSDYFKTRIKKYKNRPSTKEEGFRRTFTNDCKLKNCNLDELRPCTRYGATPLHKNTFPNFQPQPNCAMHLPESNRLSRDPQLSMQFQMEEKRKKLSSQESRANAIRNRRDYFQNQLNSKTIEIENFEKESLKRKGLNKWSYEHVCILSNLAMPNSKRLQIEK